MLSLTDIFLHPTELNVFLSSGLGRRTLCVSVLMSVCFHSPESDISWHIFNAACDI